MKHKNWIVYFDKYGKPQASKDDHETTKERVAAEGGTIAGYVLARSKHDAIDYTLTIQRQGR